MAPSEPYPVPDNPRSGSPPPGRTGAVLLDLRQTALSAQRPLMLGLIDVILEQDLWEDLVLVADYELTALAYQLDLRQETRGRFTHQSDQRLDGAWACYIRRVR